MRTSSFINPGKAPDRIEVFYRMQRHAEAGRPWFEAVASGAVQFVERTTHHPRELMARRAGDPLAETKNNAADALSPQVKAEAIAQVIRSHYARWADEPIPALRDKTPRQAIETPAGLERVKGLLRSYEAREEEMARRDDRNAISYQFLWDALGLAR